MRRIEVLLGAAFSLMLTPATAHANAFTQPKGETRIIVTGLYSNSSKVFAVDGTTLDVADIEKAEVYFNGEYGLTDDLTLIFTPSLRQISIDQGRGSETGLNYVEFGGRYRIAGDGNTAFSLQSTIRVPGERRNDPLGQLGNVGMETDVRAQLGQAFVVGGLNAFVIAEAGYRIRSDAPPDEYHADLTFGLHPTDKLLLLTNLFSTISNGDGRGVFKQYRYHNLFLRGVYEINRTVSLETGVYFTIDGENALRERGLVAGLWIHF